MRYLLVMFAWTLVHGAVGCGRDPSRSPSKSDQILPSTASDSSDQDSTNDTSIGASNANNAVAELDSNTLVDLQKDGAKKTESQPTNPAPTKKPTIVAPTSDQLERWTRATFDPLHLLAVRDWDRLGLVTCMGKTPDGQKYILGGAKVTLWSLESKQPEHIFLEITGDGKDRMIRALTVSPDGKWFATGDSEGRLKTWNIADKKELASKDIYRNDITQIAITPDGKLLATISFDSKISIWNVSTLEPTKTIEIANRFPKRLEFISPSELAVAGETLQTWDISTGKMIRELSTDRYGHLLARTPDNGFLAFGVEGALKFLNIGQGKIDKEIPADFGSNSLIDFSPDGAYMATSDGRTISITDMKRQEVVQAIDVLGLELAALAWLPNSRALVVASAMGGVRIWGSTSVAKVLDMRPVHKSVLPPDESMKEPATRSQALAVIDLRSYPRLPGDKLVLGNANMLSYTARVGNDEAKQFYRYSLNRDGWTELPQGEHTPDSIDFQKNGVKLYAIFSSSNNSTTEISLTQGGNTNVQWLPRYDGDPVKIAYESDATLMYTTSASLLKIETNLLKKMHEAGWTAYARLNSSHAAEVDSRSLSFMRNHAEVRVSIQRSHDDPKAYHVQYATFWHKHSIPVPSDSGFVEFDGSVEPNLVATTAMTLDQTRQFYDSAMMAQGWLTMERGHTIKEELAWLYYLQGQQNVIIGLVRRPDKRTLIRVGNGLENSSWQLSKPEPAENAASTDSKSSKAQVGIEAADIPVIDPAEPPLFDQTNQYNKSIRYKAKTTTLASLAEKYRETLGKFGFTEEKSGIRAEDYTFVTFKKEDAEIELRVTKIREQIDVSLTGDGLLWTKPLPVSPQIVSYESWLRDNRYPAGLELIDKYMAEMQALSKGPSQ